MTISTIDIGKDFSKVPRGRYYRDSDSSGQRLREEFLAPVFTKKENYNFPVKVILDTAEGYGASFLEEAFGGLVREGYATPEEVNEAFEYVYERGGFGVFARMIKSCIADARPLANQEMKVS